MFPDEFNERLFVLAALMTVSTTITAAFTDLYLLFVSGAIILAFIIYYFVQKSKEPYEFMIEHSDVTLTINDAAGEDVRYEKTERVRALKDNLFSITDLYKTDGTIEDISVKPGRFIKKTNEIGDFKIETSLEKEYHRNEVIRRTLEFTFKKSFTANDEFWTISQYHPSKTQTLIINFPSARRIVSYQIVEIKGQYELATRFCTIEKREDNGRDILIINVPARSITQKFKVKWVW